MGKFQRSAKPSIFEYSNYRDFLREFYERQKRSAPNFSFRHFSRLAGFNSPSVLKLVIEGKRNLSHESIEKFCRALAFNRDERKFFTDLVLLNQSGAADEKRYYAEQLLRSRHYKKLNPLKPAQFDYYTQWYYVAIREMVELEDFQEDPEWIAKRLHPAISASQARAALETLSSLGLIQRDEQGRLAQSKRSLTTGDEVDSASVVQFHKEMIQKGSESLDRFRAKDRDISSLTFGVDATTAGQVKELVQKFRKELIAILLNGKGCTDVYQLNLQLFPLTDPEKKKGGGKK